jgi:hypothetical protein
MTRLGAAKRIWAEPKLVVHGNIEHITQENKNFGSSDGWMFTPNPGVVPAVPIGPLGS